MNSPILMLELLVHKGLPIAEWLNITPLDESFSVQVHVVQVSLGILLLLNSLVGSSQNNSTAKQRSRSR